MRFVINRSARTATISGCNDGVWGDRATALVDAGRGRVWLGERETPRLAIFVAPGPAKPLRSSPLAVSCGNFNVLAVTCGYLVWPVATFRSEHAKHRILWDRRPRGNKRTHHRVLFPAGELRGGT